MFRSTVRQGRMANSWKTTPRSRPGPVTGRPSTSTLPRVGVTRPARMPSSVDLPQPLGPTMVRNSPAGTSRSRPSRASTRSRVNGLTYSCPRPRRAILAVTAGAAPAPSGRRLEVREELRVALGDLVDEPELDALLPGERRPQLLLLDEDADVLLPGRHRVGRDARVERHVTEGLAGDLDVEAGRPAGGDLGRLVEVLARVLRRLGHADHVALDHLGLLVDDVVEDRHVDVVADVPAAARNLDGVRDLGLHQRAERLPHGDRVHAAALERGDGVAGRHVQERDLVARHPALLEEDGEVLVGGAADRGAD